MHGGKENNKVLDNQQRWREEQQKENLNYTTSYNNQLIMTRIEHGKIMSNSQSHMHTSWLLLRATETIYLSIQLHVAHHDSFCIWIGKGVYLHTRLFSRANKIRSDRQVSVSSIMLLYVWSNSSLFISSLDLLSYSNLNQ